MLYRVLETLYLMKSGRRIPAGTISNLAGVKSIEALLAKNRIAEVHPPPLEIIPGFEGREGSVIEMLEDPNTPDEDRETLIRYIETPEPSLLEEDLASISGGAYGTVIPIADRLAFDADVDLEADDDNEPVG